MTISPDTQDEIAKGRDKHGLQAVMLADRDLSVIDAFGLRNQGAHSGPPKSLGAEALPVPTSVLVDAQGKVVWMDQSANYQRRSDPNYVLNAIKNHLSGRPL